MNNSFDDDMVYEDYDFDTTVPEEEEFIPLEPGKYKFKVSEIKFGEFEPSENSKAPACKKVTVILTIEHGKYDYFIKKDFLIYSKMNWLIRDFFICIGIGTKYKEFRTDWKGALHREGLCETSLSESKNGKVYINIDKFLEPDPIPF